MLRKQHNEGGTQEVWGYFEDRLHYRWMCCSYSLLTLPRTPTSRTFSISPEEPILADMPTLQGASRLHRFGASAQHTSYATSAHQSSSGKRPRPRRSVRRPVHYTESFDPLDGQIAAEEEGAKLDAWQPTDSEAEEDARIERSMGVIRKNAASRGSEGGTKYHCDV